VKVLITCPPMLGRKQEFTELLAQHGIEAHCPAVEQTLTEQQLIEALQGFDGWIIGDDPATHRVLASAQKHGLKAAVKWGVGVDNIDFQAFHDLGLAIENTPNMFGNEVADLAMGYIVSLARQLVLIDRAVRDGRWIKPQGISLQGKTIGVVGLGDIGSNLVRRVKAAGMNVLGYDPAFSDPGDGALEHCQWPDQLEQCDFLCFCCQLNESTRGMLNEDTLGICRPGLRVVNVARGGLIDEAALIRALQSGLVHSAALDVFAVEPLDTASPICQHEKCILGSHNASNTYEAVTRTSLLAIDQLRALLNDHH
jgi:D-3-phosphoglycerate dehydrogenase